jgi:hypothetical protein
MNIITLTDGTDVELTPYHAEDGGIVYRLFWGADEFTEYYQSLSLALGRLATLAYCVEQDRFFNNEPLRFSTNTIEFFKGETA